MRHSVNLANPVPGGSHWVQDTNTTGHVLAFVVPGKPESRLGIALLAESPEDVTGPLWLQLLSDLTNSSVR